MKFIRQDVLSRRFFSGTWCNLGSSLTAEIIGNAGFDWMLIDIEHGSGDYESLIHQLQSVSGSNVAPFVRIAWNDTPRFKRVLDLGPSGIMVPYVSTADEARHAVAAMRYPPEGIRGVAMLNRACAFGRDFRDYYSKASAGLTTVIQIETPAALENVEAIAAVDGVDVLFVGPLDLSASLGILQEYDHPKFRDALVRVAAAAENHGKAAGILLMNLEQVPEIVRKGYSFVAVGSDGGLVATGMKRLAEGLAGFRK